MPKVTLSTPVSPYPPVASPLVQAALAGVRDGVWVLDADGRTTFANPALEAMLGAGPGDLVGVRFDEIVVKVLGEEAVLAAGRPRPGGPYWAWLHWNDHDPVPVDLRVTATPDGDGSVALVVPTKTPRSSDGPIQQSLVDQVAESLQQGLVLYDLEGHYCYANPVVRGWAEAAGQTIAPAGHPSTLPAPLGDASTAVLEALAGRPVVLPDVCAGERWIAPRFDPIHADGDVVVGAIGSFLDVTGRVAAREALASLPRRLIQAQEAERRAVALELHDELGQSLVALRLRLHRAAEVGTPAREAASEIDDLIDRVHSLSLDLRPAALDDLGLLPAVLSMAHRMSESSGIPVRVTHRSIRGRRFAPLLETTAYRIAQEALTNAIRHAGAHEIGLDLRLLARGSVLRLTVTNDGTTFSPEASTQGVGVRGMRERAALVGGRLRIVGRPDGGTLLEAILPTHPDG